MRRRKFRQKVRQMNLDVKLRLYITMMIVGITGVMLLISTTFTVHSLYQKSIDAAHSKLGFITQSYGDWLDGNKNMMMAFQMDSNIQSFCSYKTKGAERYSVSINKVKESIENQLNQNMDMNFISVTNQEIGSYVYGGNHSVTNTRYEEAFHKGLEESQPARRKGSMRVNFGTEFFGGSKYSVTFYQPVYSTAHLDDPIGMLCVNVNDSLLEKMEESLDIKSYQTYLSDLQGNCISVMSKEKISGGSEPLSFEGKKSGEWLAASVIVLLISLILLLLISAFAAYPLSRFQFKLSAPIYALIVACMSIPMHITLIPVFKMAKDSGLYDSIWALIGPYVAFGIPISVFILTSFMKAIPKEIEEAAAIDGCNKYRMFFTMILPLSKAGLSTLAIYNGVTMWNEFSFAYTLTQSKSARTLPLAVWDFQGQYSMNTPMIMAVLTLTILPMIILYIFMQDKLVKGMTAGAVKG